MTSDRNQVSGEKARSALLLLDTCYFRPPAIIGGKLARGHADKGDLSAGRAAATGRKTPTHTAFFMDTSVSLIPSQIFRPSIYNWRKWFPWRTIFSHVGGVHSVQFSCAVTAAESSVRTKF